MSFILDALKKSEAERQRQTGPTLLEVRITPPRRRYPVWAAVVGALLGVNAVVLVAFVLRKAPAGGEHVSGRPPAAAPMEAVVPASAQADRAAGATLAASASGVGATPAAATPVAASARLATPAGALTAPESAEVANPADEQPALPAGSVQIERAGPDSYARLPSISQISGAPALELNLLDYSDQANERYALINMHRVREGDTLPEGARVLAITRDGVALDYRGQEFLLRPGGNAQ